jgi:lactobin A/cerein 7B family class IIb bacteriocin
MAITSLRTLAPDHPQRQLARGERVKRKWRLEMRLMQTQSTPDIRPLQEEEVNAVTGGLIPLLLGILAFEVGVWAGIYVADAGVPAQFQDFPH